MSHYAENVTGDLEAAHREVVDALQRARSVHTEAVTAEDYDAAEFVATVVDALSDAESVLIAPLDARRAASAADRRAWERANRP